jgi:hypothetical protein
VSLSIWLLCFHEFTSVNFFFWVCVKGAVCVLPILTTLLELTGRVQALMATLTPTMLMKVWGELYIQIWYLLGYSRCPDWTPANCYIWITRTWYVMHQNMLVLIPAPRSMPITLKSTFHVFSLYNINSLSPCLDLPHFFLFWIPVLIQYGVSCLIFLYMFHFYL